MVRMLHIARREFVSTALTKGFIFGGIVLPVVLMALLAVVMPRLMKDKVPEVNGSIALVDGTGVLLEAIGQRLTPEAIGQWLEGSSAETASEIARAAGATQEQANAIEQAAGGMPVKELKADLSLVPLASSMTDAELEAAKAPLREGTSMTDGGLMALVVIDTSAVRADAVSGDFGGFQVFVRPKLDDRVQSLVRDQVRRSIREARIAAAGFEAARLDALTQVTQRRTQEVTDTGERSSLGELNMILQFVFMFLMMMSVFISGQYLLTTTVEEKSSRVIELLLASVSPMSLMAGKIFGQMGVGLFLILVYGSLGIGGLLLASIADLIDPILIVWFFCYYFIAYTIIASLMAAIGSAVNDLREAQSLMSPVMMIVMLPYMLWFPIGRDPNSLFATIMSFVPGVSPFVMMIRLSSTQPPPLLQVMATIALGALSAYAAVWAAAKVFRVGLLMFGKAPSYATLWRWIRMA